MRSTVGRPGGGDDEGAHPKERGNPEVQRGIDGGAEQGPGAGGLSRDVVNKAHLYDQLLESADLASARQILQIKYSRTMKDLFKEIQKIMPPRGTPK
jgi:hypothetical protein